MATMLMHKSNGQAFRCTTCKMRSCCGPHLPACTKTNPFGHTWQKMGTGKPIIVHVEN